MRRQADRESQGDQAGSHHNGIPAPPKMDGVRTISLRQLHQSSTTGGFLSHGDTPGYHPLLDFPISHPFFGVCHGIPTLLGSPQIPFPSLPPLRNTVLQSRQRVLQFVTSPLAISMIVTFVHGNFAARGKLLLPAKYNICQNIYVQFISFHSLKNSKCSLLRHAFLDWSLMPILSLPWAPMFAKLPWAR